MLMTFSDSDQPCLISETLNSTELVELTGFGFSICSMAAKTSVCLDRRSFLWLSSKIINGAVRLFIMRSQSMSSEILNQNSKLD